MKVGYVTLKKLRKGSPLDVETAGVKAAINKNRELQRQQAFDKKVLKKRHKTGRVRR